MNEKGFFKHLLLDGFEGDFRKLMDMNIVHNFLDQLPDAIGMTKIALPSVHKYDVPNGMWGVTGISIISESHVSIHTWPEIGFASMDVFSCKDFDHEKCVSIIKDFFKFEELTVYPLRRGFTQEKYNELKALVSVVEKPREWVSMLREKK